jgi:hypothetical protein
MGKGYQKVSKLSLEGGFSLFGGFVFRTTGNQESARNENELPQMSV